MNMKITAVVAGPSLSSSPQLTRAKRLTIPFYNAYQFKSTQ